MGFELESLTCQSDVDSPLEKATTSACNIPKGRSAPCRRDLQRRDEPEIREHTLGKPCQDLRVCLPAIFECNAVTHRAHSRVPPPSLFTCLLSLVCVVPCRITSRLKTTRYTTVWDWKCTTIELAVPTNIGTGVFVAAGGRGWPGGCAEIAQLILSLANLQNCPYYCFEPSFSKQDRQASRPLLRVAQH